MSPFLPYGRQVIEDDDIAAVVDALRGEYLTTGPRVAQFERALAETTGAKHAVACANGTAALHLAARALNLGPGTATIVPAITFLATANAVRLNGGDVIFADVDPNSGLMRPQDLAEALARAPGETANAVFNVHLAGQCGDLAGIRAIARDHHLRIVEDACHAVGTTYTSHNTELCRVGDNSFSDLTCFSFHPVKTIAMGEGGAVTTNDETLARILALDRSHGMTRDTADFVQPDEAFGDDREAYPWYYEMQTPGLNYRIPDILCALGLSQLKKLARFANRRRELTARYDRELARLSPHVTPLARTPNVNAAWHLYVALIDFRALHTDRASVMRKLASQGIGTQVHYFPVYRQPYYRDIDPQLTLPGADEYYRRTLSLPLFPSMSDEDPARVIDALATALKL
ncbi:MAG: UDP-4-amino-4,6-dideoxy-N-acetyl-beta-L-altrosamine transaminase [Alphaproteobacteria bacterium]|nr:UDP-4-amino-4,6-dideoxy-N-acetyl-beta-L-altrosamine transaminase [Alphaproteobacteria bacterium]